MELWVPRQHVDPLKAEFGNELNNPIPELHHHVAARSSGRILRLPAPNALEKAWNPDMLSDGMVMSVRPDPTLSGTATAAATFPQQLSGLFWVPYNAKDQLGWRV